MPKTAFSVARVTALVPRESTYAFRDAALKGFGVQLLPSGAKRFLVHAPHQGRRVWKIIRDANALTVEEVRLRATSLLDTIRPGADTSDCADTTRFELVAEAVFQRYERAWKLQRATSTAPTLPPARWRRLMATEFCFPSPTSRQWVRVGPLAEDLDRFATRC